MSTMFEIKKCIKYIYLVFSLILVFWLISSYNLVVIQSKGVELGSLGKTIFYTFINDFWIACLIGIVFFPFHLLLNKIKDNLGVIVSIVVFNIVIITQFSLIKYYSTTLLYIGADLFGYSFSDLFTTVKSSNEISFWYVIPYLLFLLAFYLIYYLLRKFKAKYFPIFGLLLLIIVGSLKFAIVDISDELYQNKLAYFITDIIKSSKDNNSELSAEMLAREDFPFLQDFNKTQNVLEPFFTKDSIKPNIVFVIVEGLGSDFVGDNAQYKGFTPFLDSLTNQSLYWNNFLSSTGRTFGVLPSLLGSLPFGSNGFLEIKRTPSHLSLISLLKANGYTTSFFTGDKSSFDRKINMLEYAGIDNVIDESKYGNEFKKTDVTDDGFTWGYPDAAIFKKTLATLNTIKQPRLDIIFTITNHEPFKFPDQESYLNRVDELLLNSKLSDARKEVVSANKTIFSSLLYTDTSIKNFINEYKERDDFKNTIFIITGDHRLIPIPQKDKLCRFHVPFYIYSPLVKKPQQFNSIGSHLDVAPSLFTFLSNRHHFQKIKKTAWIGKGIDTAVQFRNKNAIPLMRNKGSLNDFILGDYLLSNNELFKINSNLGVYKVKEDEFIKQIKDSLASFKNTNKYVALRNKLFPESLNFYSNPKKEFTEEQLKIINKEIKGLDSDAIFRRAQEFAFNKQRKKARLLCDYLLNELPNHLDARTLKGRTLAWDKKYKESEKELINVIHRGPFYEDGYMAILDLYWWYDKDYKVPELNTKLLKNKITSPDILLKVAKAYKRLDSISKAKAILDSLLIIHPTKKDLIEYRQTLN